MRQKIATATWKAMAEEAWKARRNARIFGNTAVGAAARSQSGGIFAGCNIEHPFRCHDIHAEVCAIAAMAAAGHKDLQAILIVAEREYFTPCGSCMDWIFQLGGPCCLVGFQQTPGGRIVQYSARELMPHYPR